MAFSTATLVENEKKKKSVNLWKGDPKVSAGTVAPMCLPCQVGVGTKSLLPEAWVIQADPVSSEVMMWFGFHVVPHTEENS